MKQYELDARRSLLSKRLTVEQVFSHENLPSPLANTILQGSELYLNLRPLKTLASAPLAGPPPAAQEAEATAMTPAAQHDAAVSPPAAQPGSAVMKHILAQAAIRNRAIELAKSGDPEARRAAAEQFALLHSNPSRLVPRLAGAVPPGALAKSSLNLMSFGQDMTHSQVAGHFQAWGLQPASANTAADDVFKLLDNHGVNSVLAGVTVGSAVVAFLAVVKPGMSVAARVAIWLISSVIAGLVFYFVASRPNHFQGKWVADPALAHYQPGPAPQASTCTFETSGTRMTISQDDLFGDGKTSHLTYSLDADGFSHKAAAETGADKETASLKSWGNTFAIDFFVKGKRIRNETRVLSTDHREMTVTIEGLAPGPVFKDSSVYERK